MPIEHFFKSLSKDLIGGVLKNLLKITYWDSNSDENFVSGYDFFGKCVWGYVYKNLILEGPLNFFISSANLEQFTLNF